MLLRLDGEPPEDFERRLAHVEEQVKDLKGRQRETDRILNEGELEYLSLGFRRKRA